MAIIPDGVQSMVESVLSYLVTILVVLIIVKIVQLFQNIGGFKFGGGGGGSKDESSKKSDGNNPDGSSMPTSKQEFVEGQKNPGEISFLIRNDDDQNIKGAELKMWTAKRTKWFRKGKGKYGRTYRDVSNEDGMIPSDGGAWSVPSVGYKVQVKYKLQKNEQYKKNAKNASWRVFKSGRNIKISTDIDVSPGDNGRKTISLPFTGEPQVGFEPRIKDIKYDGETLTAKGVVNRV